MPAFTKARATGFETQKAKKRIFRFAFFLAEWTGLEPATPGVTGRYSNQLNYHSKTLRYILLKRSNDFFRWLNGG